MGCVAAESPPTRTARSRGWDSVTASEEGAGRLAEGARLFTRDARCDARARFIRDVPAGRWVAGPPVRGSKQLQEAAPECVTSAGARTCV